MSLILDTNIAFENEPDGSLVIKRAQEIPQAHLDALREAKDSTQGRPMGNWHRFASLPTSLVDTWKRQGFDINTMTAKEIIRKLQGDHLDAFITTTKTI
jgi:hypothetical protein